MGQDRRSMDTTKCAEVERDADRFNREHHQRHHPQGMAEAVDQISTGRSADRPEQATAAGVSSATDYARHMAAAEIDRLVKERQRRFEMLLAQSLHRTQVFGEALVFRLGQISRDEAVDALKRFVGEELERLR